MPLLHSSKIDLRKSRRSTLSSLAILILFLLAAKAVSAQGVLLSASMQENYAKIRLDLVDIEEKMLVDNAVRGQHSEVRYDLRLYRKNSGLLGIFGDSIISEKQIVKEGYWDPFSSLFVVEDSRGGRKNSPRPKEYIRMLLSLEESRIEIPPENGSYYLLAKIKLKETQLAVPFKLLDPFLEETSISAPPAQWDFSFGEQTQ